MNRITEEVARQYEAFPYPAFDPQWDKYFEFGDPSVFSPLLWPEGPPRTDLRILVAGCGTVQAARCAIRNRGCHVLGIDISEAAIVAHNRLKDERNLGNLEFQKLDLRDVGSRGRSFDLIISTGVLHHLDRPEEGLSALAAVLDCRGAMVLMLYGSAPRVGVYMLQDAFRRMGLAADKASVELIRLMLTSLPKHHYFNWYSSNAPDLSSDAGLVDTLLHARDQAYSVPQVLQLVANCGLRFQGWEDNHFYFPEGNIRPGASLWPRIKAIPDHEQWAVIENLMLSIGRHSFIADRPERGRQDVNFSSSSWPYYIPKSVPGVIVVKQDALGFESPLRYRRGKFEFSLDPTEASLFAKCNGRQTLGQIIEDSTLAARSSKTREEFCRLFFERMWKLGHLWMLSVPQ